MKIVIPDDVTRTYSGSDATDSLRALGPVEIHTEWAGDADELAARIRDADIVVSFRPAFTKFPAAVIRQCPALKLICISGTGVEDVDVAEATARGIAVANVAGSGDQAVAELCIALMFDVARQVSAQDRAIRDGAWRGQEGIELHGKTLGIVGLSAIGSIVARTANALGMTVLSWSRNNDPARAQAVGATASELDTVLAQADFLSLHLRLFPELRGFLDRARLGRMRPGAVLINTARGELVDDAALIEALSNGRLRGAGLDVFSQQPLPMDHPLRGLANVVLTPSSGWNTTDASNRMIARSIDNVLAFAAGRPINIVNASALSQRA